MIHADLGEIVTGRKAGRESPDELIHFAAIGLGVNDVAVASMVFETASRWGSARHSPSGSRRCGPSRTGVPLMQATER